MVTVTREEQLPIVKVVVGAGLTQTISFPHQFFGVAEDLRLTNLDGTNNATFQIDGESTPILTLLPAAVMPFGATKIKLLTITAGALGGVQVEANLRTNSCKEC